MGRNSLWKTDLELKRQKRTDGCVSDWQRHCVVEAMRACQQVFFQKHPPRVSAHISSPSVWHAMRLCVEAPFKETAGADYGVDIRKIWRDRWKLRAPSQVRGLGWPSCLAWQLMWWAHHINVQPMPMPNIHSRHKTAVTNGPLVLCCFFLGSNTIPSYISGPLFHFNHYIPETWKNQAVWLMVHVTTTDGLSPLWELQDLQD